MVCYKDRCFCSVKNCTNMKCTRNTNNHEIFKPDDFWKERVAYSDFYKTCKEFQTDEKVVAK